MSLPDDPAPPRPRRVSRAGVAAALVAVGLALLGGGAAVQAHQGTATAAPSVVATAGASSAPALRSTPDADEQRVLALTELLAARARAVRQGDRAAWLATVDPAAGAFRARQGVLFDNLRDLPLAKVDYAYSGVAPALPAARQSALGATAWVARVVAGYQLAGFDSSPAQNEQYLTLVRRDARWYVVADTDGAGTRAVWDLGRVHVVRRDHVLVVGTADSATLTSYAAQGESAVARVTRVWGTGWRQRAVLVVPRSETEMGALLGREKGLDQIAAVTTGELADSGSAASDRVVVNPSAFSRLGAAGRRVVLTHEITHVAVRSSTTAPVPIWLSEGFADYVGYLGLGLGRRTVAADVLALQRQGEGFTRLPTADDFDPAVTTIAPSYSAAWLACSLVADRYGQDRLVRLYRTAATDRSDDPDTALSQAFQQVLGTTDTAFTTAWLAYLKQLAG